VADFASVYVYTSVKNCLVLIFTFVFR